MQLRDRIEKFQDLKVWQRAHQLVLEVYGITAHFPPEEKFSLVSQMRRAAISVPANIVEGFKKRGKKDKANFYNISQASLEELRYYILLSKDLGYSSEVAKANSLIDEIARMLHSLIRSTRGGS